MAPSNAPAADTGACATNDEAAPEARGTAARAEPVVLLFLCRRSTARQVDATWPEAWRVQEPTSPIALEIHFDSQQQIHLLVVTSQRAALRHLSVHPSQAILVELDSRPHSREHFCHVLRRRIPAMPIFAVGKKPPTGRFSFDGYIPLPLTRELAESAAESLQEETPSQILECGPFELNLATRTVHTPDGSRRLTPKLCALLQLLMNNSNVVVTRPEIMSTIWETSYLDDTRTLDVHVRWLRESIEPDPYNPKHLVTVRGKGYTFRC
ncbi:MAG: winged-helix domain-containing protein [Caldilineaceae bacterium]|jgi:DNA-binding response OmpR family regulator